MAARTLALASTSSAASTNALSMSRSSAFSFSGREIVSVATCPSTSILTVPLAMEAALQRPCPFDRKRQADVRFPKELGIHHFQVGRDDQRKFRLIEDMGLEIDTGG